MLKKCFFNFLLFLYFKSKVLHKNRLRIQVYAIKPDPDSSIRNKTGSGFKPLSSANPQHLFKVIHLV